MRLSTHKFQPNSSSPLSSVHDQLHHSNTLQRLPETEQDRESIDINVPHPFLEQLATFPLFRNAPRSFHQKVALKLKLVQYTPQEYILKEGDPALSMYWILKGIVSVTSTDIDSVYAELHQGSFFGEIGILFNRPRTATVVARSRVLVGVLTADALNHVLRDYPIIERRIRDEAQERLSMQDKRNKVATPILKNLTQARSEQNWSPLSNTIHVPPNAPSKLRHASRSLSISSIPVKAPQIEPITPIQAFVRTLPIFSNLSPSLVHQLTTNAESIRYEPSELIFRKGSRGSDLFFIMNGEVEIIDNNLILAHLKKGSFFGEMSFINRIQNDNPQSVRMAAARSATSAELMKLRFEELQEICKEHSGFIDEIKRTLNERRLMNATFLMNQHENYRPEPRRSESPLSSDEGVFHKRQSLTFSLPLSRPLMSPQPTLFNPNWMGFSDNESFPSLLPSRAVSPATMAETEQNYTKFSFQPSLFENQGNFRKRRASCGCISPLQLLPEGPLDISIPPMNKMQPPVNSFPLSRRQSFQYMPHNKRLRLATLGGRRRSSILVAAGTIPDKILLKVFEYLDLPQLMKLQAVSHRWRQLLYAAPNICQKLDLTPWNTSVTDDALIAITDFVGSRPSYIDVSNCFHLTDEGFSYMVNEIGMSGKIKVLKMRCIWEVSAMAIMDLSSPSVGKHLEHIDLSNCRKVNDNVVERLIGWPDDRQGFKIGNEFMTDVGSRNLKSLSLGYCKSLTDSVMQHIASYANETLESLDLTRCTTITDAGFQSWTYRTFPKLKHLSLKDCTFLTDKSIISVANAAPNLTSLNLNFCCALLDIAIEVLCLGCQKLESLDLSFCGSAVNDSSLVALSLHLRYLRRLMLKGCILVTRAGVDALLSGFSPLTYIDISQCRNAHVYPGNIPAEKLKVNSSTKSAFISAGPAQIVIEMVI